MRALYALQFVFLLSLGTFLLLKQEPNRPDIVPLREPQAVPSRGKGDWYSRNKGNCNSVEIETMLLRDPPPSGKEGTAYKAACFALAGKINSADTAILSLSPGDRGYAAGIVFNIGHPVADAGDDQSAGPIMRLVLKYWPNNYMALYHAGMSEYATADYENAQKHLVDFLNIYHEDNQFTRTAKQTLEKLKARGNG